MPDVYQIRCTATGWSYYGSTSRSLALRRNEHLHKLRHGEAQPELQAAFRAHGESSFEFILIESYNSPDEARAHEQRLLDKNFGQCCYNQNPSAYGRRGSAASPRTRARMSASSPKERPWTLGRKHTEEAREAILENSPRRICVVGWPINNPADVLRFRSMKEAGRHIGVDGSAVKNVIDGKVRASAGWHFHREV